MRAVPRTSAAVDTDEGPSVSIKRDGAERTGFSACTARGAKLGVKADAASFASRESACRTGAGTRRILARPADDHDEAATHPAGGAHINARTLHASAALSAGAGEDAKLATDTTVDIDDGQSFRHNASLGPL